MGTLNNEYTYHTAVAVSWPASMREGRSLEGTLVLATRPFDTGWYGVVQIRRIELLLVNSKNRLLENTVPLSDTNTSDNP